MFNAEKLQEKWAPVLNHEGLPEIKDNYTIVSLLLLYSWTTKKKHYAKSVQC
jgi:hypothetical protein